MINPRPGGPAVYAQLAETLRARILSGQIAAGKPLPSERTLQEEFGLGRHTVRKAVGVLRAEGLVTFVKGLGMLVRDHAERQVLAVPDGSVVTARMPSLDERDEFGLDEGIPVLSLRRPDGSVEVFPADRWALRC